MLVVACPAPLGAIEPAPLTSLPLSELPCRAEALSAFWASDDQYYVRAEDAAGDARWFRIDSGASGDLASDAARAAGVTGVVIGHVGPRGGTVAFPTGSSGRTVFRVWRGSRTRTGADAVGRTRILAVRAARSPRMPA